MQTDAVGDAKSSVRTRLFSLVTLTAFLAGVVFVGHEAYRALTDAFIAPLVLSPDNELVLQNKLRASDLYAERARAESMRGSLDLEIIAAESAVNRLEKMLELISPEGGAEREAPEVVALSDQRRVLEEMADRQRALVAETQQNLDAGLVTKTDLSRERLVLSQIRVALFENDRARVQDLTSRSEQAARIELELLKVRTEIRSKRAESALLGEKLAMISEIEAQLRARPIFQAMDHDVDVAFVPYTQIESFAVGATVYECLWGLLFCEPVGRVAELLPGEVAFTDPWGKPARGQYAVLALTDRSAALSKSLRVRSADVAPPAVVPIATTR